MDGTSRGLHPAHLHMLQYEDLRQLYQQYDGKWQCDCCKNNYDTMKNEEQHAYHCNQCYYDLCLHCWYGYYHPFHNHRLKPVKTEILYPSTSPSTNGSWFCDACHRSFHELSGPTCYNCDPCGGIDLCDRCFNGEWIHPLHPERGHRLKPVDPRIVYRGYPGWCCSLCNEEKDSSDETAFLLFHCTNSSCDFDMCFRCFRGEKHHLHQHPLVKVNGNWNESNWNQEHRQCQNCARQLVGIGTVYRCFDTSCSYILCSKCFLQKLQPHPLHPEHTLECSIPLNVYPRTRGVWICSNCQSSKMESDILFHCRLCCYSICHSCYQQHNILQSSNMGYANNYLMREKPVECIECRSGPAQVTFVRNGIPHQMPICCHQCAEQFDACAMACYEGPTWKCITCCSVNAIVSLTGWIADLVTFTTNQRKDGDDCPLYQ